MPKKVIIIGSGFAGLSAASCLASKGYEVQVLEKNGMPGGRAQKFEAKGFTFDMGPSWYWMPDVFDNFFSQFGKKPSDYYELLRLDPSYSVFFSKEERMDIPAAMDELFKLFEEHEAGSSENLKHFLSEARYKYEVGMNEFVFKPGHSIMEFADMRVLKSLFRLQMFSSMSSHVRHLFKNEQLIRLLEFPVLFLGATPAKTPALYSLMNYADMSLGTWYPKGGMYKIAEGMYTLAVELGVNFSFNEAVRRIEVVDGQATQVVTDQGVYKADVVIGGADYHHVEQHLLEEKDRQYSEDYWDKRAMAPSSLLFYLGINKKLKNLQHHNLFFDEDFDRHAEEIYQQPQWPQKPLFYVCCPSVTDESVAPAACENLFMLVPLAPGIEDQQEQREAIFKKIMKRLEMLTGQNIEEHIIFKRSFAHKDFTEEYNAYKGNAYGLANTLMQTAFLKPKMRSKKVHNLFYAGQLTTPGPGVPPSIISGQVVANEISKQFQNVTSNAFAG